MRIDDERVTLRVGKDSTILHRDLIRWKLVVVPSCYLSGGSQDLERVAVLSHGDIVSLEEGQEASFHDFNSKFLVERSNIRHKGGGHEDITNKYFERGVKVNDRLSPTDTFRTKGINKSLGEVKLLLTFVSFSLSSILFIHNFLESSLKDS